MVDGFPRASARGLIEAMLAADAQTGVPRFLVLRHEASLKQGRRREDPRRPLQFPRASARGLIEADAYTPELVPHSTVSSCFGTRPH